MVKSTEPSENQNETLDTYRVTVLSGSTDNSREITVDRQASRNTKEPGNLLDILLKEGVEIDHACGGVAACSTCHVIVEKGLESCNETSEDEDDQLDEAPGVTPQSRLSCQCVPNGTTDIEVRIPSWNRNQVRE